MLARRKLGTRIHIVMGVLSVFAAAVAMLGHWGFSTYDRHSDGVDMAARRALVGEQVNGAIYSVVMDSRGVYMSRSAEEARKFATPMLKTLNQLLEYKAAWKQMLAPEQVAPFAELESELEQFVAFRRELARLGVEVGPEAGRAFGDNDANRSNRQRLNVKVKEFAQVNNADIERMRGELAAFTDRLKLSITLATLVGIVLCTGWSVWMTRRHVTAPFTRLMGVMGRLAEGDLDVQVPETSRTDEFGDMARALQQFKETAARVEAVKATQQEETTRTVAEQRQTVSRVAEGFERRVVGIVSDLDTAAGTMRSSATDMADTARDNQRQATIVAAASEQASANVATVAAAAEQLTASFREIGLQVAKASKMSGAATEQARRSNALVEGLSDSAERIGEVVQMIHAIASQTNLLALNATIEAARAGEAGKGFAVVASEVKGLANQTAKATGEISTQIAAVQAATKEAVEAIRDIGGVIVQIDEIAAAIAAAVEEQDAASSEISRNVQQASQGTREVSSTIVEVSRRATHAEEVAAELSGTAGSLASRSADLRREIEEFLILMRAAGDRRRYERKPVNMAVRVALAGGRTVEGQTMDLSLGGARLDGLHGDLRPGQRITMDLGTEIRGLSASILAADPSATRLMFETSYSQQSQLVAILDRLEAGGETG